MTRSSFLLHLRMFVRKKKNRSGSITVVVVDKCGTKFKEIHNLGTTSNADEVEQLLLAGKKWIADYGEVIDSITGISQDGAYRLLEFIYSSIGFNDISDKILKDLSIARVCEPRSKLATVDYMRRYWSKEYHYQEVYRYLDTLYNTQKEDVLRISVEHTRQILGDSITLAFYDVTTLYFESFREDNLRAPGFSKDGKTAETQIVLGLLVSRDGYPLSFIQRSAVRKQDNDSNRRRFHPTLWNKGFRFGG